MTGIEERQKRAAELVELRATLRSIEEAANDKAFQEYAQVIKDSPYFQKEIAAMRARVAELELIETLEEERGGALEMLEVVVGRLKSDHDGHACRANCTVCEDVEAAEQLLAQLQGETP